MTKKAYIIEHGHLDLEWLMTREDYARIIKDALRNTIVTLHEDKRRHYAPDQLLQALYALKNEFKQEHYRKKSNIEILTDIFMTYERNPRMSELKKLMKLESKDELGLFKELVSEGRIELISGMLVQPDLNMVQGESLVRQILEGKKLSQKELGKDVDIAWCNDSFGHSNNLPQILKKSGFKAYFAGRCINEHYKSVGEVKDTPLEFYWKGLNGDKILVSHLNAPIMIPVGGMYSVGRMLYPESLPDYWLEGRPKLKSRLEALLKAFKFIPEVLEKIHLRKVLKHYEKLGRESILLPMGNDFTESHPRINGLEKILVSRGYEVIHGRLSDYVDELLKSDLTTIKGDFNTIFEGVYTSRMKIKQGNRELENAYRLGEFLESINHSLGSDYNSRKLDYGLELMLMNQFHDTLCGCSIDEAYINARVRYSRAKKSLNELIRNAGNEFSSKVRTEYPGYLILNQLSWDRRELVTASCDDDKSFKLIDESGNEVPYSLNKKIISFTSPTVPALGYTTVRKVPGDCKEGKLIKLGASEIENEYYKVSADDSGVISIHDKKSGRDYTKFIALDELILSEGYYYDKGEKRVEGLDMTVTQCYELNGCLKKIEVSGSLGNSFIKEEVTLTDSPSVDFNTWVKHKGGLSKINAVFKGLEGELVRGIPYGELRTNKDKVCPAVNYVRVGNVTISNNGVIEHKLSGDELELGLFRSHNSVSSWKYHAGPPIQVRLEQINKDYNFKYSLSSQDSYKASEELNNKLMTAELVKNDEGLLGLSRTFHSINNDNLAVSALKKADDGSGYILRVYNPTNKSHELKLQPGSVITDLMENELGCRDSLIVEPFGIYTIKLDSLI